MTQQTKTQKSKVYEIVKVVGLGMLESPNIEHSIGLLFSDKKDADKVADNLWKDQTSEEERKSGWCALHFIVKERQLN